MTTERKVGKELIEHARKYANLDIQEAARACGYVSKKNKVQTAYYTRELLKALGLHSTSESRPFGRGKVATSEITVQANGVLVVGATYIKQAGLATGDRVKVKVAPRTNKITLLPIKESGEEDFDNMEDEEEEAIAAKPFSRKTSGKQLAIA